MLCLGLSALQIGVFPDPPRPAAEVTVGRTEGDLRGDDQRVIQGAIDYVAGLGGGTVTLLSGTYTLWNSVHLRSHVSLVGHGNPVLRPIDGFEAPLITDGDYGEAQVSVAEPDRWRVGMGIAVGDRNTNGFLVTVATVTGIVGNDLLLDRRIHGGDLLMTREAWARAAFPPISAVEVEDVRIAGLTIDGNKDVVPSLNGCVAGGIFLFRCANVRIENCIVRDYRGDGISFQTSHDVTVSGCEVFGCTDLGIHPGSGSQRPVVTDCYSHHNGADGLFVCWRVRGGRFERNRLEANGRHGISIGHKDTDNLFVANQIRHNGGHGVLFRPETEVLAAHRNTLRDNLIEDNGTVIENGCGIRVEGATADLMFAGNTIRCGAEGRQRIGIWLGRQTARIATENNRIEGHAEGDVVREAGGEE